MRALVLVQVDQRGGGGDGREGGRLDGLRRSGKRDHGAVMVGVAALVEDGHAGYGADGVYDPGDDLRTAAFAEVGHTFHQGSQHKAPRGVGIWEWAGL